METIEVKDTKKFKLTITKSEVRIKVPEKSTEEQRQDMAAFFRTVVEKVGPTDYTLRGHYNENGNSITMKYDSHLRPTFGKFIKE